MPGTWPCSAAAGRRTAAGEAIAGAAARRAHDVLVLAADVADRAELAAALTAIERELPALRGVVHAAGVLADATLAELDVERLARRAGAQGGRWLEPARG